MKTPNTIQNTVRHCRIVLWRHIKWVSKTHTYLCICTNICIQCKSWCTITKLEELIGIGSE